MSEYLKYSDRHPSIQKSNDSICGPWWRDAPDNPPGPHEQNHLQFLPLPSIFFPSLQTIQVFEPIYIMPFVGDHIWLMVGDQLQYNLSTLHALCLVSTQFCNIFTPLLYRHVSLFAIHKRHLKRLSQSPYVRYTRTLNIACLEARRYVTQEWVDFSAALEKMSNLREIEYVPN